MEIEKKFRVTYLPKGYDNGVVYEIEQGYLCSSPTVRIRKKNDDYILTYKSRVLENDKETSKICMNHETELWLSESGYLHLKEKADGNMIEKTRYLVQLENGYVAELDIFHGCLEGLIMVEVEFESAEDAKNFKKPDWFGDDISGDIRFTNSHLSGIDNPSELL